MENTIYSKNEDFYIENLNPEIAKIYPKYADQPYTGYGANNLVLDFGEKTKNDILDCTLRIKGLKIDKVGASCGCTHPTFVIEGDDSIVTVRFDKNKVTNNVNKMVYLYKNNKPLNVNLWINKKRVQ